MKPFDDLNIVTQKRYKNKHNKQRQHTGLDTETFDGYVKLITDNTGRYKMVEDIDDIIYFLTHSHFRSKFNWFFNIRFDFESIVKYLEIEELQELYANGELHYHHWDIHYIAGKYFSIIDGANHSYRFYDLNNFLSTSLNNASNKYLKEGKLTDIVDSSRLNTDIEYWKENEENIIKYCIQDSALTQRLAVWFFNLLENSLQFLPNAPYSKGSFAQEYFLHKCYIPTINGIDREVLRYAYNSYSGGRFEILKRGKFDHVYTYDIKSAYPSVMANLIDVNNGKWYYTTEYQDNAYYGYYHCKVEFYHSLISPFMVKEGSLNIYPNGKYEQWLTQKEIEFILSHFNNVEIEVIDGWYFIENSVNYPLKEEIEKLYEWKNTEKDDDIKYVVKIVLNSLYGKFIQTVGGNTGRVFNPIWATEITANTRLQLLELALQNINSVIGMSTDSVHSEIPLTYNDTGKLGAWDLDFEGEGIFVMSDVYALWNEKKTKNRFRGFRLYEEINRDDYEIAPKDKITSLLDILQDMPDSSVYNYVVNRPIHLGEILAHTKTKTKADMNVWSSIDKSIKLNGDKKRVWSNDFKNGLEAYEVNHCSIPHLVK